MRYNNIEISVKVKNKPITEYPHNGQVFIEGRAGSNFEIVLKNHNNFRVEAVVSVDGLSILDGKDAGPQSEGYLLNAGETMAIPGWTLNKDQVAAFTFAGKGGSYAEQSPTASPRNKGVIGVLAYRERVQHQYHNHANYQLIAMGGGVPRGISPTLGGYVHNQSASISTLASNQYSAINAMDSLIGATASLTSPGVSTQEVDLSYSGGGLESLGMVGAVSMTASAMPQNAAYSRKAAAPVAMAAAVNNLGTGFGEATAFRTETVSFHRGDMQAMIVLYYDDARGLKARGIVLARTKREKEQVAPNAFPGMTGCVPPPGWRG